MNQEIKDIFFKNNFKIVFYDSDKYTSYFEAMTNNDFISFIPETNAKSIGVLCELYDTSTQSIEAINSINGSNYKAVVPLFYFDFIQYNNSEISNDLYDDDFEHCDVITSFVGYIIKYTNMPIIVNNETYNLDEFDFCFGGYHDKINELIYEDVIGNVSIDGLSLKDFYDFLVIKEGNIEEYKKMKNFKNF